MFCMEEWTDISLQLFLSKLDINGIDAVLLFLFGQVLRYLKRLLLGS